MRFLNLLTLPIMLSLPCLLVLSGCRPAAQASAPVGVSDDTAWPASKPYTAEAIPFSAGFPLTVTDDVGVKMTFDKAPQRIISLAPSLTELLFALGLGDRIIGVTEWCKYPPEALKKPKVGGYINSSQEKIVSLAPDVIFCTRGTPQTFMQSLRGSGLKVFAVDQTDLHQVVTRMIVIGHICGVRPQAQELAGQISALRNTLREKTLAISEADKPRVLFLVEISTLFVAGPGSYQDDILKECGTINIAQTGKPFASLSEEVVVTSNPQVLIIPSDQLGKLTKEQMLEKLRKEPMWGSLTAVREGNLIVIPTAEISIPGPRLVQGIKALARQLHPELFKDL
ncbi:MAG: ABC transporter substrate-binding protein [Armatimonadota bacterium]